MGKIFNVKEQKLNWQYALLEVVLIFIGITLAIWVQNWDENVKKRHLEIEYVKGFQHDLNWDKTQLEEFISLADNQMRLMDSILVTLNNETIKSEGDLQQFFLRNFFLTRETYFVPEKSTYNQLLSASHGHILQDKQLKDHIFRYYTSASREEKNNEKSVQLYQHHWVTPNIIDAIVPTKEGIKMNLELESNLPNINITELLQNKDYLTALVVRKEIANVQRGEYQKLLNPIDSMLNQLGVLLEDLN